MKPELMSPAGGINSFIAAIDGGADSVYLGLQKFNARRPAKNFDNFLLKKCVTYAHEKNVKVFVTINIDLKSNEIAEAYQMLNFLVDINVDAVIVKDPALIYYLAKYLKNKIDIHISTQSAVSSSLGVIFFRDLAVNRVVLARELELPEIRKCASIQGIEIEIFTEGSMCFGVSGRCLASSFIGGHSGNRGACAACCRIAWEDEKSKSKKSYFSMKDLSLSEYIKTLEKYGVAALKIEGRLKNANWVKNITSIYRQILDGAIDDDEQSKLKNELKKYSARETHSGHIIGHKNLVGENAHWDDYIKTTDDYAIPDIFTDNIKIKIETNEKTVVSVYLKDQYSTFEFKAPVLPKKARPAQLSEIITKIKELNKNMETVVELSDNEAVCSPSYLNELTDKIKAELKNLEKKSEKYADLSAELNKIIYLDKTEIQRPALFGSMPDKLIIRSDQISFFNGNKIDFVKTLVIYLYKELNIDLVSQISKKYDIIFAIPDVIFEKDIDFITATIDKLIKTGYKKFQSNSFDGMEILKKYNCEKSVGLGSAIMNHIAPKFYQEFGYSSFYAPVESDVSILKSLSSFVDQKIECLVYGKIPLFISRVEEDCYKANKFRDKYIELESYKINELYYFVTSKPLCFIGEIFKKENIKFDSLTADMRFFDNPYLKVLDLKNNKPQIDKDYSFNFFRKLV